MSEQAGELNQGNLTEGEGSVHFTSSLRSLFCKKVKQSVLKST
jgi:hypothetical protein